MDDLPAAVKPERKAAWERLDEAEAQRLQVLANDYGPVPCIGKIPTITAWQDGCPSQDEIKQWTKFCPKAMNTGITTAYVPTCDIDITNVGIADEIQTTIERLVGADPLLIKFGRRPKRSILFKTALPFEKMQTGDWIDQDGVAHHVEILCDGQQTICFGRHPDTGTEYEWPVQNPLDVPRERLPELNREQAQGIINAVIEIFRRHGLQGEASTSEPKPSATNGGAAYTTARLRERRHAEAAMVGSAAELANTPEGSRNATLNAKAYKAGTMVEAGWVKEEAAEAVLLKAARDAGLEDHEAKRTLRSGLNAGKKKPRPPLQPSTAADAGMGSGSIEDDGTRQLQWKSRTFGADALQTETFPPLTYLLPGLLPEGLCELISRPKLGKSWLALDIAIATAADRFVLGMLKPQVTGEVLYLALEDGKRRLQRRLTKLLPTFNGTWPPGLTFATEWPRSDQGGLADIEGWIKDALEKGKHPRLIVVDTLALFRKLASGKQAYQEDYTAVAELQNLASKYNITIIVVHHDRKSGADDVFDTVSGTLGLTGAADTIAILKREAGAVTFHVRGRDIEEAQKALQFNKHTCRWTILGEAVDVRRSDERARVLAALQDAGEPLPVSQIIFQANLVSRNAADNLLLRMAKDGDVERIKRGLYCLPGRAPKNMREMREKERSEPKPLKEQCDNGRSHNLTHLTQVLKGTASEPPAGSAPAPEYLGPPDDDPADFLGDIPDFLRRA
jgi:AAA domain